MSERFLLMEIHSERCLCSGGAYAVTAGQTGNRRCLSFDGQLPEASVVTSMDQWLALGKPMTTEAHHTALRRLAERRELPRFNVSLKLRLLRTTGVTPHPLGMGVTENVGEGGVMMLTTAALSRGEEIVVEDLEGALRARALVEGAAGVDGGQKEPVFRVRLRFLDAEGPRQMRKLLFLRARQG